MKIAIRIVGMMRNSRPCYVIERQEIDHSIIFELKECKTKAFALIEMIKITDNLKKYYTTVSIDIEKQEHVFKVEETLWENYLRHPISPNV